MEKWLSENNVSFLIISKKDLTGSISNQKRQKNLSDIEEIF